MLDSRVNRRPRRAVRSLVVESLETRRLLSVSVPNQATSSPNAPVAASAASFGTPVAGAVDFNTLDGASQVRAQYGVNGTGMTAAAIDLGVDYQDQALGGGFGPGYKVIAGQDFADNSPNPIATTSQHGTAVASLIASNNPAEPGVAPGANLVELKVFNNAGQGNFQWIADALQYVINNHQKYNITVVNISITDGNNYAANWFTGGSGVGQTITNLIDQLDQLNIPVVAAAGNSFQGTPGMGFPAIVGDAISVTSTDGANQIASDAQRLAPTPGGTSSTTIAAPGVGLSGLINNNQYATLDGTSFAAPQVTGAVILLQQIYQSRFGTLPTVAQIKQWLQQGSDPVYDPATGATFGRLDIPKAASLIPQAPATAPATIAPQAQVISYQQTSVSSEPQSQSNAVAPQPQTIVAVSPQTNSSSNQSQPQSTPSAPSQTLTNANPPGSTPAASSSTSAAQPVVAAPPAQSAVTTRSTPSAAVVSIASNSSAESTGRKVTIVKQGVDLGKFGPTGSNNPWSELVSLFDGIGRFATIDVWKAINGESGSSSPFTNMNGSEFGVAHPAGTIRLIRTDLHQAAIDRRGAVISAARDRAATRFYQHNSRHVHA